MSRSEHEGDILSDLRESAPKGRRRATLFAKLDKSVPGWRGLVHMSEFAQWASVVDSENGTCMLDRIRLRLDDPVFAAEDLAIIFRMFARWKATESRRTRQVSEEHGGFNKRPVLSRKYELIKGLGHGGSGEVNLVWSTETEKFYALKTIRSDLLRETHVRQAFRDEAGLWISMGEHPNVAKAYFFEEERQSLYITMEYVEEEDDGTGPSLADKLASGRVRIENLCVWFCQIADGLSHAYKRGIRAHRDIKPSNILINREGVAQISDFGIATTQAPLFNETPNEGYAAGTPFFMPPEQFAGQDKCDQRSDIYSLGVTLYQAVSGGILPFSPEYSPRTSQDFSSLLSDVSRLHQTTSPRPLPSFLWPVIAKCLEKRQTDRFTNIQAFREKLSRLAGARQIFVPEPATETTNVWVLRDQGNTFMRLGRYEDAIQAFDSFLAIHGDESAAFNRAVCLENLERYEEALQEYDSFATRGDIKGIVNIGNCLRALGRKQEALEYANRAVALAKDDVCCWITLGNAQFALDNWGEAIRAYETAHQLEPMDPTPPYNIGLAALRSGLVGHARQAFLTFMESSMPDDKRRPYVEGVLQQL